VPQLVDAKIEARQERDPALPRVGERGEQAGDEDADDPLEGELPGEVLADADLAVHRT